MELMKHAIMQSWVCSVILENKLIQIMKTYEHFMRDLELVQQLNLPYGCISAGYVRNYVWDCLHGFSNRTPLNDVDILYYDSTDLSEDSEKKYESFLKHQWHGYNWSVKNQARMHIRNQDKPYLSVAEAMKRWPETATAVGISLDNSNKIEIIAPHGLHDLFDLVIRRSAFFKDTAYFYTRIHNKKWLEVWPQLRLVED
jgi:hypothetical protein